MVLPILCCLASGPFKKVATITVNELYQSSSLIVLADVKSVSKMSGIQVATAQVIRIFKGKPKSSTVNFVAERTWTCDISKAIAGEKVILYLNQTNIEAPFGGLSKTISDLGNEFRARGTALYNIEHSGRGRLPVHSTKGLLKVSTSKEYSDRWQVNVDLVLPNPKFVHRSGKEKGIIRIDDLMTYR